MADQTITAEEITRYLDQAKQTTNGYKACCPAHDDHNPSLSITDREDGGVLIHCHAGCAQDNVIEALRQRGLWPAPEAEPSRKTTYTYQNADGTPAFHVHRTDYPGGRKKIVQRLPDGQWKAHPTPRPLFNLPAIVSNPQQRVLVVEGEKTALAAAVKFPADWVVTTSSGGSNAAKQSDWSVLKDREVLIWPDHDEPGYKYAEDVKRLCEAARVRRVVIFSYPEDVTFPVGWDLADPIPEGLDLSQTQAKAEAQPEPDTKPARGLALTPWSEAIDEPPEDIPWIVDNMLPAGGTSLMAAKPKVAKSTLSRGLAAAVAEGGSFLGREVQQGVVIYLGLEEKRAEVLQHFRRMGVARNALLHVFIERAPEQALERLKETIEDIKPVLVVIDPLFRFLRFKDGNDYAESNNRLEPFVEVARKTGAHLLVTHHATKVKAGAGDEVLGSTGIFGAVDTLISLRKNEATGQRTCLTIQRYGTDLEESVLTLDPETGRSELTGTKKEADTQTKADEILAFLAEQTEGITEKEIKRGVGGNTRLISVALRGLFEQEKVVRTGEGKKGKPYLWALKNVGFANVEGGPKAEKTRNQNKVKFANGLDPPKNAGFLVSDIYGKPENQHPETIADHVAGLTGEARDEATQQLVLGWLH